MSEILVEKEEKQVADRIGKVGMWLSIGCAIHCVVTPVAITVLPMLNLEILHNPIIELSLLGGGMLMSGWVAVTDYRISHRNFKILLTIFAGFALLLSASFFHNHVWDLILSLPGATLVIIGLLWNYRAAHNHKH